MAETIAQRDLRNDVSAVLRRVAAGESFTVGTRFEALPVTRAVAMASAEIRAAGRTRGIRCTPFDALICGTAAVHGSRLFTQDAELGDVPGVDVRVV